MICSLKKKKKEMKKKDEEKKTATCQKKKKRSAHWVVLAPKEVPLIRREPVFLSWPSGQQPSVH